MNIKKIIGKEAQLALEEIGVSFNGKNLTYHKEDNEKYEYCKEDAKCEYYKVTNNNTRLRRLNEDSMFECLLSCGDIISFIDDECKIIDKKLHRKIEVIECKIALALNKVGWIDVSCIDAPKDIHVKKFAIGSHEITEDGVDIRSCENLDCIGKLTIGDSIDIPRDNDQDDDIIVLNNKILRKVIIKENADPSLVDKKFWIPTLYVEPSNKVKMKSYAYQVSVNTELYSDLDFMDSFIETHKGDLFKFDNDAIRVIDDGIYKKVIIIKSADKNLEGKTGWIDVKYSDALVSIIKPAEKNTKKKINSAYRKVVASKGYIGYQIDGVGGLEEAEIIEVGTTIWVSDKKDSRNRVIVQIEKKVEEFGYSEVIDLAI